MYLFHSIHSGRSGQECGIRIYFSFFLEPFSNSNVCKFMMLFMSKRTLFTSVIYAVVGALSLFLFYVAARNTVSLALMFSNVIIFYPDKFTTTWMVWISLRTTECGQERMVILYRWLNFCPSLVSSWVTSFHLFFSHRLLFACLPACLLVRGNWSWRFMTSRVWNNGILVSCNWEEVANFFSLVIMKNIVEDICDICGLNQKGIG